VTTFYTYPEPTPSSLGSSPTAGRSTMRRRTTAPSAARPNASAPRPKRGALARPCWQSSI